VSGALAELTEPRPSEANGDSAAVPGLRRTLCCHCLLVVVEVVVGGVLYVVDLREWLPPGICLSCAQTRRAHPTTRVRCSRCNGLGVIGEERPPGRLIGVAVDDAGAALVRVVEPGEERRGAEALHVPHVCSED
jgi:hypothetical protein